MVRLLQSIFMGEVGKTRCWMRTKMTSALLLSVAAFAILSLLGWTRPETSKPDAQTSSTDDESTLFVG